MRYHIPAGFATFGLIASIAFHLMGWLHVNPPWGNSALLLHIGVLIVWIPLVISANRTMPKRGRGNMEHLLAELPSWVRVATRFLFAYALLNFAYFIFCTSQYPKHKVPFFLELRGFSGHWMLFYGFALVGYIALGRLARKQEKEGALK
jgi:hypothetical protein